MPPGSNRLKGKEQNTVQIPFRLHKNDRAIVRKLLADDGISFQKFVDLCFLAYVHGDPVLLKMIRQWKAISSIPKEDIGKYALSQRERISLADPEDGKLDKYTLSPREKMNLLDEIGDFDDANEKGLDSGITSPEDQESTGEEGV